MILKLIKKKHKKLDNN